MLNNDVRYVGTINFNSFVNRTSFSEAKIKALESIIERAKIKDNTNIYSTYDNINYKYIVSD